MSSDAVIRVARRQKLSWLERLYLPMIARALAITTKHLLRNLRTSGTDSEGLRSGYPDAPPALCDAFRGMPVLVAGSDGEPRCDGCGLCVRVCPAKCIHVEMEAASEPGSSGVRAPNVFDIDMGRCMFCGLCEEVCPDGAIVMSPHVELAVFDRESMVFHKEALLVPSEYLTRRLVFLQTRSDEGGGA